MNMAVAARTILRQADLGDVREIGRIEAWLAEHPASTPFHRPAWLGAVAKGCGQTAHMLLAERSGRLVGLLPLTEVHSPLFGRALVSSGFAVGGGVLADQRGVAEDLAATGWSLAQRLACPTMELRGGMLPPDWTQDDSSYAGFSRPIALDDEAELLAIPRKQRAEVRRALGFDLDVVCGSGERDRADHYAVYRASVHNLGTPVFPRALFDAVLDAFGDDADILTVRHEGRAIASVLSLYHRGTVLPYWGGGTAQARSWRANDLMYFALMRHARARGCSRFDFGRSKPGTGAYAFKRNWGFEPQPLVYASKSLDGTPPRKLNPLDPRFSRKVALWRSLPAAVANRIGPMIARGLG